MHSIPAHKQTDPAKLPGQINSIPKPAAMNPHPVNCPDCAGTGADAAKTAVARRAGGFGTGGYDSMVDEAICQARARIDAINA